MPGRNILPESAFEVGLYAGPAMAWRRQVLRETIGALQSGESRDRYLRRAHANVARWREAAAGRHPSITIRVRAGDWGEVTLALTRDLGTTFAVLNMANAESPGGAYVEGAVAQEENMFRRTDCHFAVSDDDLDPISGRYRPSMTSLINAAHGVVYLDSARPRVCLRGPELSATERRGYGWLPDDEIFPFFELRAAARDYRDGRPFDEDDARRRIAAQLDTLIDHQIRHAVLGASGCGAFRNPPEQVARIYREELKARPNAFDCVAFAIHDAGYGPSNYEPFARILTPPKKALRSIDGEELLANLDQVLLAIETGAVFEVANCPSPFVLGTPSLGRVFATYDEREYGWPEPIEASAVVSLEDLAPSRRRHPLVTRNGRPIALSLKQTEYERFLGHDPN